MIRNHAMSLLGNGLFIAMHFEAALTVQEAEMSMLRRFGASEENMLVMQNNLASTYKCYLDGKMKRPTHAAGSLFRTLKAFRRINMKIPSERPTITRGPLSS